MASRFSKSLTAVTLKAMSVFGGVQALTILCSIVRNKLVAVWIGPVGVGLLAIYNSAMEMLTTVGQLNLRQSAVREISAAAEPGRPELIAAVRRLALWLGLGGMAVVALGSPLLGYISFGSWNRWYGFALLSLMMLTSAVASGELAVLQGLSRLRRLAKVGLWTAVTATAVAVPLFWFFRIRAVAPVILIFALSQMGFALAWRERLPALRLSARRVWQRSRGVLSLGAWLTASAGLTLAGSYLFLVWLNHTTDTSVVGMYQAGYTLINSYVGVIFTAISMEYYPRLSAAVGRGPVRTGLLATHETLVCLWVLIPVIVVFISCSDLIVRLLYSGKFEAILPFISIAVTGTLLKAQSWCMAFVILAKGDGRMYIVSEATSVVLGVALNMAGWTLAGWVGLGVSYVVWYGLYTAIVYAICRRYGVRTRRSQWWLLLVGLAVAAVTLALKWSGLAWVALVVLLPLSLYGAWRAVRR